MIAKKIALGCGIALILPLMVHYGVRTFSPEPKWSDYQIDNYYEKHERANEAQQIELEKQRNQLSDQREKAEKRFQTHLFFVAVPVGIAAVITGTFLSVQAIGAGLIFGGIFSLINGYCWYWQYLDDRLRFASLLVAFIVLIVVGYMKFAQKDKN